MAEENLNWSTQVEDLVDNGDTKGAISLLESLIHKLETLNSSTSSTNLKLATALSDLANLYSSQGFSIKADQLQSRSFLLKQKNAHKIENNDLGNNRVLDSVSGTASSGGASVAASDDDGADDWESIADRPVDEILTPTPPPPIHDIGISKLTLEDSKPETTTKRRGRGAFMYKKNSLYSDQQANSLNNGCSDDTDDDDDDEVGQSHSDEKLKAGNSKFGTSHVLVLADFPTSTRTMELEKLFESFKGFVIRWVNDTVALAVFKTPSIALEACNNVHASFKIHVLDENDSLLSLIPRKDLEPPTPRPKTSVRTAQRLIAQGMGRKLSTETFGSAELRKQEEARKNRIVTRQILKDEAWGND
ncbi:hypothetical protein MKW94_021453 [Papaver nudicaule]|uniref:Coiled-coil domain-containing protein R3HCC1L n=1 Tax=Papaver nudicaule TaxID=74823 RepID=A0AA41S684_PAPNU|nr:hypothetical protein [Papaver nudicaule]